MSRNPLRVLLFVLPGIVATFLVLWLGRADSEPPASDRDELTGDRSLSVLAANSGSSAWTGLESIASDACLTEQAASSILATADESVFIGFLAKLPEEFWEAHPNANVVSNALGRKWASANSPSFWWARMNQLLAAIKINAFVQKRVLLQAVVGALEVAKLGPTEVEELLGQCTSEQAKVVVEAWVATSPYNSPRDALNDLLKVWRNSVREANQSDRRFLASIALRYHVSRLKRADELIQYIELAAGGADFDSTLLEEVVLFHPAIYESCLIAFGNTDPTKAAELARRTLIPADKLKKLVQGMGNRRHEFLKEYLDRLSLDSPQAGAALADTFSAKELPLHCRAIILHAMLCVGDGNVGQWLTSLSQKDRTETLNTLSWERAEKMGLKANWARSYLHYQLTLPEATSVKPGHPAYTNCGEAIGVLAESDIEGALSLLDALPATTREKLTAGAYFRRARHLRLANQMEDCYALIERAPASLVPDLLKGSLPFEKDLDTAVAAVNRFQITDEVREKLMDQLLSSSFLSVDLQKRQEAILGLIGTSPSVLPKSAIEFVIGESVYTDPSSGSNWILQIPSGPAREHAISLYASKWASFDPVAASEWIAEMPAGHERDLAAKELVFASLDDLEIAFANAAAISDPKLQFDAASQVVRRWRTIDPQGAFDYLEKSPLARDVVQRLQATMPSAFFSLQ